MNSLNSVLLEGTIKNISIEEKRIVFNLESYRYFYKNGTTEKETSIFTAHVYGPLKENFSVNAVENREVRLVGTLKTEDFNTVVVAEHIEFKPVRN